MEVAELIREIEEYITLYPLLRKRNNNRNIKNNVVDKNNFGLRAVYISETSDSKGMLDAVLEYCNEDILDELINTYGEESEIGQYIRRKRAFDYTKVSCELNTIERPLEAHLRDAQHGGNPFYEAICKHLDRLGYKSDADFYNSISMPRQQFSRLRDVNSTLSKKTVLWIIVGLKLDYVQARDMLQKGGYTFRKNDMRDVILTYIFRNTTYDLDTVNLILDHFGIEPLC